MTGRLVAVDLGLRIGLAVYRHDGKLEQYRSHNLGTRSRLKRAAASILSEHHPVAAVVLEGDATIARPWQREAERAGALTLVTPAERWRAALLHARERRDGATAKRHADRLARAIISWSAAPAPTTLRHDAAEAICLGLYGVLVLGWLDTPPAELDLARR